VIQTPDETEFIFVCTDEHKKEIDLYMDQLINEPFAYSYFRNIFLNQFVRILCFFLNKITVKIKHKTMTDQSLINCNQIDQLSEATIDESKSIQVVFLPYMTTKNFMHIIKFREKLPKNKHLIVLTICCFHQILKKFVNLKNMTIFNLFCIANEHRFEEVLRSNIRQDDSDKELFGNTKLITKALKLINDFIEKKPEDDD
jgi:hypothetical protein